MQTDNAYCRQGYAIQGQVVQCLKNVKWEENRQEITVQIRVLPFNSTDRESNQVCKANGNVQLKPEQKEKNRMNSMQTTKRQDIGLYVLVAC